MAAAFVYMKFSFCGGVLPLRGVGGVFTVAGRIAN